MIELEARAALRDDSKRLVQAADSGKLLPQDVSKTALSMALRRLRVIENSSALRAASQAVNTRVSAVTHSDMLTKRFIAMLTALRPHLCTEVLTGVLMYTIGDSKQYGIAVVALQILAESSGVEGTAQLTALRDSLVAQSISMDKDLLERASTLPIGVHMSVRGAIEEAKTLAAEGDGRSAMNFLETARKLIRRYDRG